jgi:hypothetical protein
MKNETNSSFREGMTTLSECMENAVSKGFGVQFVVTEQGIAIMDSENVYSPQEVRLHNFYRFEGESDPDDTAILYLIEMTDGTRGTLADAYGLYADERLTDFLKQVPEIHKRASER